MPRLYCSPSDTLLTKTNPYTIYGNFCIDRNYRIYYNLSVANPQCSIMLFSNPEMGQVYLLYVRSKS